MFVYTLASVDGFPVRAAVSFLFAEVAPSLNLHMHCCKKPWSIHVAYRVSLKSDMQPTHYQSFDICFKVSRQYILLHVLHNF